MTDRIAAGIESRATYTRGAARLATRWDARRDFCIGLIRAPATKNSIVTGRLSFVLQRPREITGFAEIIFSAIYNAGGKSCSTFLPVDRAGGHYRAEKKEEREIKRVSQSGWKSWATFKSNFREFISGRG